MTTPQITAEVSDTFRQGASEASEAWQRAFGEAATFSFQDAADVLTQVSQEYWNCSGLAVVLSQASGAIVLLVADPAGALPVWVAQPDATGKSKLATFAQELGLIALPASLSPTGEQALRIENLQEALLRCQLAGGQDALPLTIQHGTAQLPAMLLGIADAASLTAAPAGNSVPAAAAPPIVEPAAEPPPRAAFPSSSRFAAAAAGDFEDGIPSLPSYTRSLLKIRVPLVASLATTQLPVGRILEIGPGSIIQFDQSCEQPLSLAVGDHAFAVGEAVKVGEKFGLRITSMVMPEERFWSVRGQRD